MATKRQIAPGRPGKSLNRGFSVIELLVVMVVSGILAAMAVPQVVAAVNSYQLQNAINTMSSSIQSTRYQAIFQGNTIRMAMNKTNSNYQISSAPGNTTVFTNVGGTVGLPGSISANTTLEFHPSGQVKAVTGALNFTLTYHNTCEAVTVTSYGNVNVIPC